MVNIGFIISNSKIVLYLIDDIEYYLLQYYA